MAVLGGSGSEAEVSIGACMTRMICAPGARGQALELRYCPPGALAVEPKVVSLGAGFPAHQIRDPNPFPKSAGGRCVRNARGGDGGEQIGAQQRAVPDQRRSPVVSDDDRGFGIELVHQGEDVAHEMGYRVRFDVLRGTGLPVAVPRGGDRVEAGAGEGAAADGAMRTTTRESHGTAPPEAPIRAPRSAERSRSYRSVGGGSLAGLVLAFRLCHAGRRDLSRSKGAAGFTPRASPRGSRSALPVSPGSAGNRSRAHRRCRRGRGCRRAR